MSEKKVSSYLEMEFRITVDKRGEQHKISQKEVSWSRGQALRCGYLGSSPDPVVCSCVTLDKLNSVS